MPRYRGEGGAVWLLDEPLPAELASQVRLGYLVRLPDQPTEADEPAAAEGVVAATQPHPTDAKSAWVDYAVAHGESRKTAERMSRAELVEQFGSGQVG